MTFGHHSEDYAERHEIWNQLAQELDSYDAEPHEPHSKYYAQKQFEFHKQQAEAYNSNAPQEAKPSVEDIEIGLIADVIHQVAPRMTDRQVMVEARAWKNWERIINVAGGTGAYGLGVHRAVQLLEQAIGLPAMIDEWQQNEIDNEQVDSAIKLSWEFTEKLTWDLARECAFKILASAMESINLQDIIECAITQPELAKVREDIEHIMDLIDKDQLPRITE